MTKLIVQIMILHCFVLETHIPFKTTKLAGVLCPNASAANVQEPCAIQSKFISFPSESL